MKNKRTIRIFTVLLAVMLCMAAFPLTAFAGGGEESSPPPTPTSTPQPDPIRLTPDGNLTLVDDIQGAQAEDKQFITVITKGGNYFYLIIDRAGDKENVYFLNLVDEADLLALIEDKDQKPAAPVVTPPTQPEPIPTPEPEPQLEQKGGGIGGILALLLIVAGLGGGAFYYFKVLKPKQAAQGSTTFDELDFEDEDESAGLISEADSYIDGQEDEE